MATTACGWVRRESVSDSGARELFGAETGVEGVSRRERRTSASAARIARHLHRLTVIGAVLAFVALAPPFSAAALAQPCVGDCDDNREVSIDELLRGVNIVLGLLPASACPAFDQASGSTVGISDLIVAVINALNGCPSPVDTPTPEATGTPTAPDPTSTPSATPAPTLTPIDTVPPTIPATHTPTVIPSPTPTVSLGGACAGSDQCAVREWCMTQSGGPVAQANAILGILTETTVCECLPRFDGVSCDECAAGHQGPDCTECSPGFTSNQDADVDSDDSAASVLRDDFLCEPDADESCEGVECSGHGRCTIREDRAVCACDEGYTGASCFDCVPDYDRLTIIGSAGSIFFSCILGDACRDAHCGGRGDCVESDLGDITCACDQGFAGPDCGGPPLTVRAVDSDASSLYNGESILLVAEHGGGIIASLDSAPFIWRVESAASTILEPCPVISITGGCPPNGARLTILAEPPDVELVTVVATDGDGNSASTDLAALPSTLLPFTGKIRRELLPFYRNVLTFMRARGIRAGALAVSKGGVLMTANGFGFRDAGIDGDPFVNAGEGPGPLVQPNSPFRLASVSKPLTAAAVRQAAMDAGVDITQTDQANRAATWVDESISFSLTSGFPPLDFNLAQSGITDSRWANVSIQHLLNHHAGLNRGVAPASTTGLPMWSMSLLPNTMPAPGDSGSVQSDKSFGSGSTDVAFATMYVLAALQRIFDPRPTPEQMILFMSGLQFNYNPGGGFPSAFNRYSNLGYIMLGRVLEGLKGEAYDPDLPGVPDGWGPYPQLLQDYLCEASGIQDGVFPGDSFNPQPLEPYYRDIDWQENEVRNWNLADSDLIRWNPGLQNWQFCQSNCGQNGAVWNYDRNALATFGGLWLAEWNSAGGTVATGPALIRFARNHRVSVGSPNSGSNGTGSRLAAPAAHINTSRHNGSLPGTRTMVWQMAGETWNVQIPFPALAWNDDPSAPLDLDASNRVKVDEGLITSSCGLPVGRDRRDPLQPAPGSSRPAQQRGALFEYLLCHQLHRVHRQQPCVRAHPRFHGERRLPGRCHWLAGGLAAGPRRYPAVPLRNRIRRRPAGKRGGAFATERP